MKRALSILFILLLSCSRTCEAGGSSPVAGIANCPQYAVSGANVEATIGLLTAPLSDITVNFEFMGVRQTAQILAGEKEAKITLSMPVLENRENCTLNLLTGDGYALGNACSKKIVCLLKPEFQYEYGDGAVLDPGEKLNVYAIVKNAYTLRDVYVEFELRDETGAVLAAKGFSKDYPRHPFTFQVPKDWTQTHMLSIWLGDQQLSPEYPVMMKRRITAVKRVETDANQIAITIDCGGGGTWSATKWLDLLDQYNAHATFFVTGRWASENPEAVKDIFARGHEIGNHTWNHREVTKLTYGEMVDEIERTNEIIAELANGYKPTLFRAPKGTWSYSTNTVAEAMDLQTIQWSNSSGDSREGISSSEIQRNAMAKSIVPGSIVLFHCGSPAIGNGAMNKVFDYYVNKCGYQLVSISELFPKCETTVDQEGIMRIVK